MSSALASTSAPCSAETRLGSGAAGRAGTVVSVGTARRDGADLTFPVSCPWALLTAIVSHRVAINNPATAAGIEFRLTACTQTAPSRFHRFISNSLGIPLCLRPRRSMIAVPYRTCICRHVQYPPPFLHRGGKGGSQGPPGRLLAAGAWRRTASPVAFTACSQREEQRLSSPSRGPMALQAGLGRNRRLDLPIHRFIARRASGSKDLYTKALRMNPSPVAAVSDPRPVWFHSSSPHRFGDPPNRCRAFRVPFGCRPLPSPCASSSVSSWTFGCSKKDRDERIADRCH